MKKFYFLFLASFLAFNLHAQDSLNCEVLFHWDDPSLVGSFAFDNTYNEVWGFVQGDREYAVIGSTAGTHIFDVTDPANAVQLHFVEGAFTGGGVVHRDYHDYQGYLYTASDEGTSTLQIIDISNLPASVEVVYDSNALFTRAHNLFIDETRGVLYAAGGSQQLKLFSLEDPTNPTLILDCQTDFPGWSQAGYIHDLYVKDGIAYLNAGGNGLFIADFNDTDNPVFLGSLTSYPDQGYNHSGWLHPDGEIYALADETHGMKIKILDVSDPSDINVLSLLGSEVSDNSIVHNVIFDGDYLHMSYYYDGYYVFDVSDPANPVLAAFYDTCTIPNTGSYKGVWGVYPLLPSGNVLISDMQNGLYVLDPDLNIDASVEETGATEQWRCFPTLLNESNYLQLAGLPAGKVVAVIIYNELGQEVYSNNSRGAKQMGVLLPPLAKGTYLVKLTSGEMNRTFKIVK